MEKVPEFQDADIDADAAVGRAGAPFMVGLVVWCVIAMVLRCSCCAAPTWRASCWSSRPRWPRSSRCSWHHQRRVRGPAGRVPWPRSCCSSPAVPANWFKRVGSCPGGPSGYPGAPYGDQYGSQYGSTYGSGYGVQPGPAAPVRVPVAPGPAGREPLRTVALGPGPLRPAAAQLRQPLRPAAAVRRAGSEYPPRDYPNR